jgi:hypothetical protein
MPKRLYIRVPQTYLLVHVQLPEDLGGVKKMLVLEYPNPITLATPPTPLAREYALLPVECQ